MTTDTIPSIAQRFRPAQLDCFELVDPADSAYSQAIELYDALPKYVWEKRVKPFHQDNTRIVRTFRNRGRDYELRLYGAILDKDSNGQVIAYPSRREEVIEDALRKITVSSGRSYFAQNSTWCEFTLHELQQELISTGHTFSKAEIKEALTICHQTRIEVSAEGKTVTSGYMLPSLTLVSSSDLRENKDAHCVVRFHEMVTMSIKALDFRQYNYKISMSLKHSLARSLFKRLSYNWRTARLGRTFGPIYLTTVFRDAGRNLNKRMHENRRSMVEALDELTTKSVLSSYTHEDTKDGRRIVDISYTMAPHPSFTRDMRRFNHFAGQQQLTAS